MPASSVSWLSRPRSWHHKKGRSVLREKLEVKYAFMQTHLSEFKITTMSWVLGVSRCGFYRFRQRAGQPTKRQQKRMVLDKLVVEAFTTRKMRAGSPRLVLDLLDQGHRYMAERMTAGLV